MKLSSKIFTIVIIPLIICSCATVRLNNQGNIKSPIEMNTYRITIQDEKAWQDWAASKKPENDILILEKLTVWPLTGEVQKITRIAVIKDTVSPEGWGFTEKEHADIIRNNEEKIMIEKSSTGGMYQLQNVNKSDLLRNDKMLYVLTWRAPRGSDILASFTRSFFSECAMYLYFPKNFKDTHIFYRFMISDSYIPGTIFLINLDQVLEVIDGFEIK
ncbi:MAG: hypothetical protein H6Q52_2958 [Deltaproteobacteria bacterium]|nr:hypothetical protein [Deltaproteobacteria bacterium]